MTGILKREKQIEWACRILMTADVFIIAAGYISYFQAEQQLISPLIPKSTVYQVLHDSNDVVMKASLISGGIFLSALWFYSFKKKIPALVLLALAAIFYKILLIVL
jgi:hypothetical protein